MRRIVLPRGGGLDWSCLLVIALASMLTVFTPGRAQGSGPIPEPGWLVTGEIAGMVITNRPRVTIVASSGSDTAESEAQLFEAGGVVRYLAEVPFETRFAGDSATAGRLPLVTGAGTFTWTLRVNGIVLPLPPSAETVAFGPADRGRLDRAGVNFAVRASTDTFATWSQRIFGRLVSPTADEDGDGRSNGVEFDRGSSPLDPASVPANRPPLATLTTNRFEVSELTQVTVTNVVSDSDQPANRLTWRLVSGPQTAELNVTNGIWSWTPSETDGPATNEIVVAVDDDGVPPLSATNRFTVIVREVNEAPALVGLTNATVPELGHYMQVLAGTDSDVPVQTLAFSLVSGPAGSGVTNGVFGWAPGEAQGPSTNEVVVAVSDGVAAVNNSFMVVVREVNVAPVLAAVADRSVDELTALTLTLTVTDADRPNNALTFGLVSGPGGLTVSGAGVVGWTPNEAQGPSTNTVVVKVTDDGEPPLSATNRFMVIVRELNEAPTFVGLTNATVPELVLYMQALAGTDPDVPVQTLVFSLVNGPAGSGVTNGVFGWVPGEAQGPSTNEVVVAVSDGVATVTNRFTVVVLEASPLAAPKLTIRTPQGDGSIRLEVFATRGTELSLETSITLETWSEVQRVTGLGEGTPATVSLPSDLSLTSRFWRVRRP